MLPHEAFDLAVARDLLLSRSTLNGLKPLDFALRRPGSRSETVLMNWNSIFEKELDCSLILILRALPLIDLTRA